MGGEPLPWMKDPTQYSYVPTFHVLDPTIFSFPFQFSLMHFGRKETMKKIHDYEASPLSSEMIQGQKCGQAKENGASQIYI